jgi:hypothetical protein
MVLLEIVFVRHGISCANAWGRKGGRSYQSAYPDPELTEYGVQRSVEKGPELQGFVATLFPDGKYSIGASCMMRAQQTAHYMLAKTVGKPINIMPHIGELSNGTLPGYCNFPLSPASQRKILDPEIVLGVDARGDVTGDKLSNWPKFTEWAATAGEPFFTPTVNSVGETVHRAVIVGHSLLFKDIFGYTLNNNDVIYAKIDTGAGARIVEQAQLSAWKDIPADKESDVTGCRIQTKEELEDIATKPMVGAARTRRRKSRGSRRNRRSRTSRKTQKNRRF